MALTVNSNIPSINAQRNLLKSTSALAKSLERLSSGLRINRAGDDAAGLAISEDLRAQIRGLGMAVRNANDGISLVATAEGAIQEVTNIIQRIRELAIQAANDTNSASNRSALQLEVDQLIEELQRISTSVQFNGQNLFDGTFTDKKLQIGAMAHQTIDVTISDLRAEKLGAAAVKESSGFSLTALASNDLIINGIDIGTSESDGLSFANPDASAISMVNAINAKSGQTGVMAEVIETEWLGGYDGDGDTNGVSAVSINSLNRLIINGVDVPECAVVNDDADGALRNAINSISNLTGVTASMDEASANFLVLTAEDGRNITVETTDSGNNVARMIGFQAGTGAMAATTRSGKYKIYSDEIISVSGNNPTNAGLSAQTVSISYDTALNMVDITSHEDASDAITSCDFALRQINSNRAALGAITNRLEMTVSNLETISENLTASESRIRDADFAHETAQLTRNQILQQAGTTILAQANQTPQIALQLLQG